MRLFGSKPTDLIGSLRQGVRPIAGRNCVLLDFLGQGSFGQVWRVEDDFVEKAFKFIPLKGGGFDNKELAAIERLQRVLPPNCIKTECIIFLDDLGRQLTPERNVAREAIVPARASYLVLGTTLAKCSLRDRLASIAGAKEPRPYNQVKGIPLDLLSRVLSDVGRGLDWLNAEELIHCDIKPANILLIQEQYIERALIADFGIARGLHDPSTSGQQLGSPAFISPECLSGRPSIKSDQYSLAVTTYLLATGHYPFPEYVNFQRSSEIARTEMKRCHSEGELDFHYFTEEAKLALNRATDMRPECRFETVGDFVQEVNGLIEREALVAKREVEYAPFVREPAVDDDGDELLDSRWDFDEEDEENGTIDTQSRRTTSTNPAPLVSNSTAPRPWKIEWPQVLAILFSIVLLGMAILLVHEFATKPPANQPPRLKVGNDPLLIEFKRGVPRNLTSVILDALEDPDEDKLDIERVEIGRESIPATEVDNFVAKVDSNAQTTFTINFAVTDEAGLYEFTAQGIIEAKPPVVVAPVKSPMPLKSKTPVESKSKLEYVQPKTDWSKEAKHWRKWTTTEWEDFKGTSQLSKIERRHLTDKICENAIKSAARAIRGWGANFDANQLRRADRAVSELVSALSSLNSDHTIGSIYSELMQVLVGALKSGKDRRIIKRAIAQMREWIQELEKNSKLQSNELRELRGRLDLLESKFDG